MFRLLGVLVLVTLLVPQELFAFVAAPAGSTLSRRKCATFLAPRAPDRTTAFRLHEQSEDSSVESSSGESNPSASAPEEVGDEQPYPLDIPSPILLGSSVLLAIVGTGSLFEIIGGKPQLGFGLNAAIFGLGLPLCLFLFYASIKKAQAETEADDAAFLNRK